MLCAALRHIERDEEVRGYNWPIVFRSIPYRINQACADRREKKTSRKKIRQETSVKTERGNSNSDSITVTDQPSRLGGSEVNVTM